MSFTLNSNTAPCIIPKSAYKAGEVGVPLRNISLYKEAEKNVITIKVITDLIIFTLCPLFLDSYKFIKKAPRIKHTK